jgi:hypothetical protein
MRQVQAGGQRAERFRDILGFADVIVSKANDLESQSAQVEIAATIVLKCRAAAMEAITVGFDDERLPSPEEIHLQTVDLGVHLGRRQSMTAAEPEEEMLELASSAIDISVADRVAEHRGLADRTAQLGGGEALSAPRGLKVGDRSEGRSHRNSTMCRGHGRFESLRAMEPYPGTPPPARVAMDGDMDRASFCGNETP